MSKFNRTADKFSAILTLFRKTITSIRSEGVVKSIIKAKYYFENNRDFFQIKKNAGSYQQWVLETLPSKTSLIKKNRRLKQHPKISIIMPVFDVDPKWLSLAIKSVMSQVYENWELCIVDDGSKNVHTIEALKSIFDPRIKIKFSATNHGIAHASNQAISMASGKYVALMDHDDEITIDALYEVAKAINETQPDLIYSDEDKIDRQGIRRNPFFKPDWSIDLLRCQNYICHFTAIRKSLLGKVNGFRKNFEGAQDHDLFLRISEQTDRIHHIPKVLYSWREIETSTAGNPQSKPKAQGGAIRAVDGHVKRVFGDDAYATASDYLFVCDTRYPRKKTPRVSIIIPTKDKIDFLAPCIQSILSKTTYRSYEIIILDNNSEKPETLAWLQDIRTKYGQIKVTDAFYPFCWSKMNNQGIDQAGGDVFIFLNNDTRVISTDWIERLSEQALRDDVGAVGPLMLYQDGTIQHAGVVLGHGGWADHIFKGMHPVHYGSPFVSPMVKRNVLAVSGSCMAISRNTVEKIGNFDEEFLICGSDVEICIRAYENGLKNIYDPFVQLYHFESKTRSPHDIPACDFEMSQKHYKHYRQNGGDPYFNINLSLTEIRPTLN